MVYEGPDDKSKLISEVFGTPSHKVVKSISSLGNSIFIDFKKKSMYTLETVEFEAFIKYNKFISACKNWLDVKTNILTSPNDPNTTNCSWLITANFGSCIVLNFKFIEVPIFKI